MRPYFEFKAFDPTSLKVDKPKPKSCKSSKRITQPKPTHSGDAQQLPQITQSMVSNAVNNGILQHVWARVNGHVTDEDAEHNSQVSENISRSRQFSVDAQKSNLPMEIRDF